MTPEEKQLLIDVNSKLNSFLDIYYRSNFPDKVVLTKKLTLWNQNIDTEGTVGTKIGNSASKLSVYGATTVVRAGAISAPATQGATYNQSDVQSIVTAVNSIRTVLTNFGITS